MEQVGIAKGLEPTLQITFFHKSSQRLHFAVPFEHGLGVCGRTRDQTLVHLQRPSHVAFQIIKYHDHSPSAPPPIHNPSLRLFGQKPCGEALDLASLLGLLEALSRSL